MPLLRPAGLRSERVMGLLGVLSYEASRYEEETLVALQWLAGSVATLLHREQEDAARRAELGSLSASFASPPASPAALLGEVSAVLQGVRRQADAMRNLLPEGDEALTTALDALCRACEQGQTDVTERLLSTFLSGRDPLAFLTEAEHRVLPYLMAGRKDREIALALCVSPHTVKSHCRSILRKFGVTGRAAVAEIARPFLTASSPD